jgi:methyl-accepting chemotaxis protein
VARAAEAMRDLGEAVRQATDEQQTESTLITTAIERVRSKVGEILLATREQTNEGETFDAALQVFEGAARAASRRVEEREGVVSSLAERSRDLELEINRFRV